MAKQKFHVTLIGEIDIELEDAVIEAGASEEFKFVMGYTMTPQEVAADLAYHLIVNGATLDQLDGFADQPKDSVKILRQEWNHEN